MSFIADFHIHSHYSRATSKEMNLASLTKWGQIKGIQVMGTGDFTHPAWFAEIREKLEEAEEGLFRLKKEFEVDVQKEVPLSCRSWMRFLLTVEISTIFSRGGKVRKVHTIVGFPSFATAAKFQAKLAQIGNLQADGRPILGLDTKELMKIAFDASPECLFIPAHIWTPHFGVLGSNSGFESLEECFGELTPQITALETGLSSDPAMNWRLSGLDQFTLVSNSDAHSPPKLGREANRFEVPLNYASLRDALKSGDPSRFLETIEFYPEEGKYHLDGHRACKVCLDPSETIKLGGICPQCGRKVTVGVMHRVELLADRKPFEAGERPPRKVPFRSVIPLPEILADVLGIGLTSSKLMPRYFELIHTLGNEFALLLDVPIAEIEQNASPLLAEAIARMRRGEVKIAPGYDGEYGVIELVQENERQDFSHQAALF